MNRLKEFGLCLLIAFPIFFIWYLWLKFFVEDFIANNVSSNSSIVIVVGIIFLPLLISIVVLLILNYLVGMKKKNHTLV